MSFKQLIVVQIFAIVAFVECMFFSYLFYSKRMLNKANHGIFKSIVYLYTLSTIGLMTSTVYKLISYNGSSWPELLYINGIVLYYFYILGIAWGIIWVWDIHLTMTNIDYTGQRMNEFTFIAYGCPFAFIVILEIIILSSGKSFVNQVCI